MNLKPVMNPKSVTWGSVSFNGVKAVSFRQSGSAIRDCSDTDTFETVIALARVSSEVVLHGDNVDQQIGSTMIGGEAELRFTLDGARSGDEPITFVAPHAVLVDKKLQGGHGQLAAAAVRFALRSEDGSTAPIGVS